MRNILGAAQNDGIFNEQMVLVKADKSQQKVPVTPPRCSGVILTKLNDICFLKASQKLPSDYTNGHIRIFNDRFSTNGIEVRVGDEVSFELGKKDKTKPMGLRPQVVRYSSRTYGEVQQFLSHSYKSLEGNSMSTVISLLSPNNKATWNFFAALNVSSDVHIRIIFKIFDCFKLIAKHAENSRYEKHAKDVLAFFLDGSAFSQLIKKEIGSDRKKSVATICNTVSRLLPSHSASIYPLIKQLTIKREEDDFIFLLNVINNIFGACKDDAMNQAMLPTSQEFANAPLDKSSELEPVCVNKPYNSYEEYGEIYYQLLRAEAFSAIQDGVKKHKNNTLDLRDMNVFTDIVLTSVQISRRRLCFSVKFKPAKKVKSWKTSSQLMYGNLLCLSPRSDFRDPIWAVVADRNIDSLEKEKMIFIEFLDDNYVPLGEILSDLISHNGKTVMVESPTYYEAIRSSLKIFRSIKLENYLLGDHIVFGSKMEQVPNYLEFHSATEIMNDDDTSDVLDYSQAEAFDHCMRNKIGIIQGPPGTGKTFVGFQLAKHILEIGIDGPILMLSYKNHALDEFLLKILTICDQSHVVRIGGQSKEPKLEQILLRKHIIRSSYINFEALEEQCHNLQEVTKNYASSAILGNDSFLEKLSDEQRQLFISKKPNGKGKKKKLSLQDWGPKQDYLKDLRKLERVSMPAVVYDNAPENEEDEEEDEDMVKHIENDRLFTQQEAENTNKKANIRFDFNFQSMPEDGYKLADLPEGCAFNEGICSTKNLWELDNTERIQFIYTLLKKSKDEFEDSIENIQSSIKEEISCSFDADTLQKCEKLKEMKVIGATITGAAIHHEMLNAVRPKVVIVEEAAEILEPSLVAAINPDVEHLILIGDHKQLRPQVDSYKLVTKKKFDISMMERLINIGYPYRVLKRQGRMRTEFAELLKDIYPEYESFDNIDNDRPPFPHFSKSMYFWSHSFQETKDRSYRNEREADMALSLAYFLIACGVEPKDITILAAYVNQLRILRKGYKEVKDRRKEMLKSDIVISTIDMYQGDENEFVIVSLVRSNKEGKIGFLKNRNRRCVAQSRARRGMYFVGNSSCFQHNPTWSKLVEAMSQQGCVGSSLIVKCDNPKHKIVREISNVKELNNITESIHLICREKCAFNYKACMHPCTKDCKPSHNHEKCLKEVPYQVPDCKHTILVECYREIQVRTYQDTEAISCTFPVTYFCPDRHKTRVLCEEVKKRRAKCVNPCEKIMKCPLKHPCKELCGDNHDHLECKVLVPYNFDRCGHKSVDRKMCTGPITSNCKIEVEFKGSCGHTLRGECEEVYRNKSSIQCPHPCPKTLKCSHPCPKNCSQQCPARCEVCKKKEEDQIEKYRSQVQQKINALKQSDDTATIPLDRSTPEYQSIVDRVMKYIQPMHNWYPKVTQITIVKNTKLEEKFLKACLNGYGRYTDLKFHGTSITGVQGITKEGFRLPTSPGMYGKGIYLATDSSKSAQEIYTKGSKTLLLCDVFLGNGYQFQGSNERKKFCHNEQISPLPNYGKSFLQKHKCDSIYAPRNSEVKNDEFIVFNPDQVFPKYIISYEVGEVPRHRPQLAPSVGGFNKHRFKFSRNVDINDPYYVEASVAVSHYNRTNRGQNMFKTDEIDIVQNSVLEARFDAMKAKLLAKGLGNEILAFHATALQNIDSILRNNLDPNRGPTHGRAHGNGCYFSEFPNVSASYGDSMILFRVLPGKEYKGPGTLPQSGYDSKKVSEDRDGYGQMLIIQNAAQFLPAYVFYKR